MSGNVLQGEDTIAVASCPGPGQAVSDAESPSATLVGHPEKITALCSRYGQNPAESSYSGAIVTPCTEQQLHVGPPDGAELGPYPDKWEGQSIDWWETSVNIDMFGDGATDV